MFEVGEWGVADDECCNDCACLEQGLACTTRTCSNTCEEGETRVKGRVHCECVEGRFEAVRKLEVCDLDGTDLLFAEGQEGLSDATCCNSCDCTAQGLLCTGKVCDDTCNDGDTRTMGNVQCDCVDGMYKAVRLVENEDLDMEAGDGDGEEIEPPTSTDGPDVAPDDDDDDDTDGNPDQPDAEGESEGSMEMCEVGDGLFFEPGEYGAADETCCNRCECLEDGLACTQVSCDNSCEEGETKTFGKVECSCQDGEFKASRKLAECRLAGSLLFFLEGEEGITDIHCCNACECGSNGNLNCEQNRCDNTCEPGETKQLRNVQCACVQGQFRAFRLATNTRSGYEAVDSSMDGNGSPASRPTLSALALLSLVVALLRM